MKRKDRLPELLAPAGDFECLVAAVRGGADAVYIGGKLFSARAYAKNFDIEEIKKAVSYCHLHGVRLYVTMNTQLSTSELAEALSFACELYSAGVDAVIAADLGLIRELRRTLPRLEIHASTQLSVHSSAGADEAYRMGCSRVVLARELSRENMASVVDSSLAECEVFLHGALCVCHSGQCLFSSMVGGRSGNRGECAQPCRLPYNGGKYPLSLKDLSLSYHIPELISLGVSSLKIEGRMKSADYVYTVTSVYRRLLDENRCASKEESLLLKRVFSRGDFTDGYFKGEIEKGMTGVRTEGDKKETKEMEKGVYTPDRVKIYANVSLHKDEPSRMTVGYLDKSLKDRCISVFGDAPKEAISSPLCECDVKARLSKMGNTFLSLDSSDIELDMDSDINMSQASLNALRRRAAEAFSDFSRGDAPNVPNERREFLSFEPPCRPKRTALFFDCSVLNGISEDSLRYFDSIFVPLSVFQRTERADGVYVPPVITDRETEDVRKMLSFASEGGAKLALVGNIGHISLVREAGLLPVADFRFNIWNSYSAEVLLELGFSEPMLSPELSAGACRSIGGRCIVYGRLPLMLTERCFMRENFGCDKCSRCALTDRRGMKFPIIREYQHRNLILNSAVTFMADKMDELSSKRVSGHHFIFTTENVSLVERVIDAYKKGRPLGDKNITYRRIGK